MVAAAVERSSAAQGAPTVTTCGFCGSEFEEDRSQATCQACPLSAACGLMRCPTCGYENPRSPEWITRIRKWVRK